MFGRLLFQLLRGSRGRLGGGIDRDSKRRGRNFCAA